MAEKLKLEKEKYGVVFQSRLGGASWVQPYLVSYLHDLAKQGIKKIAIVCPSFVLDCLETLEEVGIRAREQWQALGGETFTLIPALNTHPQWIKNLSDLIKKRMLLQID